MAEVEEKVYEFLKLHNRPFSTSDIQKNLGEIPRSDIQKVLQDLVEDGKVLEKTYGKQKIFCIIQDHAAATNMEDELKDLDRKINTLNNELDETKKHLLMKTSKIQEQKGKMSMEEAVAEKTKLEIEILALKKELKEFEEYAQPISEKERVQICEQYHKYEKEYKSRKKMCREVINGIMENYPKSEKNLLEEIGIETDEDVGFKYEPILK